MSRYFMIQSWVGSHENEPDYNGQQAGERNVRSSEVVPLYDKNGRANTQYFSDEAIAERMGKTVKKSSVSIEDKILPQAARLRRLTEQLIELEQAKKAGMNIDKYSKLRDVLIVKRNRYEVLLQKALSVKPIQHDTEQDEFQEETQEYSEEYVSENGVGQVPDSQSIPEWLQGINPDNCLRNPLIKACKAHKTLVRWATKTKHYINELKAV